MPPEHATVEAPNVAEVMELAQISDAMRRIYTE
jgi:hypothetical protein